MPGNVSSRVLRRSVPWLPALALAGLALGCKSKAPAAQPPPAQPVVPEAEIPLIEGFMLEHAALHRVMGVYDACRERLVAQRPFDMRILAGCATIVRGFVEDHHEREEELYIFPLFEKAGLHVDLVAELRTQHRFGRSITDEIQRGSERNPFRNPAESARLRKALAHFNRLYRPHALREDTVVFPNLRHLAGPERLREIGLECEALESQTVGEEAVLTHLRDLESFERQLGIWDLAQYRR